MIQFGKQIIDFLVLHEGKILRWVICIALLCFGYSFIKDKWNNHDIDKLVAQIQTLDRKNADLEKQVAVNEAVTKVYQQQKQELQVKYNVSQKNLSDALKAKEQANKSVADLGPFPEIPHLPIELKQAEPYLQSQHDEAVRREAILLADIEKQEAAYSALFAKEQIVEQQKTNCEKQVDNLNGQLAITNQRVEVVSQKADAAMSLASKEKERADTEEARKKKYRLLSGGLIVLKILGVL